ncbi:MAG: hypothetical protein Q4P18_07090 [Methanobrevibacter sp.]|uniref:hypothetical protein n=1 Tax=Methanobrevibacter sp. TaxID=66852 RepID=UPI0026DF891D|nr:hypothetical protein [Methanobrevibacter sp.]MDO5849282.1 hypothetical protein [Methanobrevibacter sp.]
MVVDKKKVDKVVSFLESCWDENQESDDGLSFDERVRMRMEDLPNEEKSLVEDALSWS